jgi:predicted nucleic acid-binding protein
MPVLVDTNVLLDIAKDDPKWAEWSLGKLEALAIADELFVNAVVYAELSVGFDRIEDVDRLLDAVPAGLLPIPADAAFLAGKAFLTYRRRGGSRTGVLPDFLIGAHAAVTRSPLVTRDSGRYRSYFPTIELIAPDA